MGILTTAAHDVSLFCTFEIIYRIEVENYRVSRFSCLMKVDGSWEVFVHRWEPNIIAQLGGRNIWQSKQQLALSTLNSSSV